MASERRRFFPLFTTLYREPWPREWKLSLAMLGMLMTDRWASDRLTDEQAERTRLSEGDLRDVTGLEDPGEAVKLLRSLARVVSIKVRPLGNGYCEVHWRKFSESLKSRRPLGARPTPGQRPADAPSSSSSSSSSLPPKKEKTPNAEEEAAAPPARARIVNVLRGGDPPAEADEKLAWWEAEGERIEAEAVARSPDGATPKQISAKTKSIAIGWWQQYLKGPREHRGAARERALERAAEETRRRLEAEHQRSPPPADAELPLVNVRRIQ